MNTYIALIRGINVSGQKKIKMADLKLHMVQWGFTDVSTYIQSGNLVFNSSNKDGDAISDIIRSGIQSIYGFEVGVWVRTQSDFARIVAFNPFAGEEEQSKLYFVFLSNPPSDEVIASLEKEQFENEEFRIYPECIFLLCHNGYGKAKCNNNFFEHRLKVRATTRNLRTVNALLINFVV